MMVGDYYKTAGVTVTEAHVVGFAGLSGDLFDVHMDDEFARAAGFPGRIAHGLLAIASLHWNWSYRAPLHIGDRIHVEIAIAAKRLTKRDDRGILTLAMKVVNQRAEVVQDGEHQLLVQVKSIQKN
jgi:acyl dehydratase